MYHVVTSDVGVPSTYLVIIVTGALAPNRRQAINNYHADPTPTTCMMSRESYVTANKHVIIVRSRSVGHLALSWAIFIYTSIRTRQYINQNFSAVEETCPECGDNTILTMEILIRVTSQGIWYHQKVESNALKFVHTADKERPIQLTLWEKKRLLTDGFPSQRASKREAFPCHGVIMEFRIEI